MDKIIVVKLGGATLGSHDTALEDIVELQRQGKSLVVVHGGGKLITEWLAKQGVSSRFIQGERVTDQATLEVVIAVLAGLVNKEIVAAINSLGGRAVGISGVDGALIEGSIGDKEKGYVGEVVKVNTTILEALLDSAFIPVVAPVGLNSFARPTDAPRTLNFNADVVAGEIAAATAAERLIFLTDVAGISDEQGKLLTQLSPSEAEALVTSGVASGGMIPKIKACLRALSNTSTTCIIDGRQPHALLREVRGSSSGTIISSQEGVQMVELVKTEQEIVANINQFNKDLDSNSDIKTQLSMFTHWYYLPEVGFGPGKYIGYKKTNTANYNKGRERHGSSAEYRLRDWFVPLREDNPRYDRLFSALEALLSAKGKYPGKDVVIHVRGGLTWQELANQYFMHTVDRVPVTLIRGEGTRVWDEDGKEYLDFVAGWAVNSLGHCHPVVAEAVTEQARTLIQTSNQFYTIPQIRLAELLVENSCLDKVFFCNSGAEAGEGAVKLARRYGKLKLNGAYEVITALNSFHGRTLAMVAASGQAKFQQPYLPLPSGFINVEYNSIEAIKAATTNQTCAVMLEPIQGEGGVNLPDDDYLRAVRAWCDQKGILLILDEIQTGIGRVGTLFAYEQYGIEPDIMTLAKGLASGIPIGAILVKDRASVFAPGEHGSTFGGNPVACAAGYATVKFIIDHDIVGNAKRVGQYFTNGLERLKKKYHVITDVRGRGLLLAMEFSSDIAGTVLTACLAQGLLVNRVKPNALRFMPPLIIGNKEIDEAIDILDQALSDISKKVVK